MCMYAYSSRNTEFFCLCFIFSNSVETNSSVAYWTILCVTGNRELHRELKREYRRNQDNYEANAASTELENSAKYEESEDKYNQIRTISQNIRTLTPDVIISENNHNAVDYDSDSSDSITTSKNGKNDERSKSILSQKSIETCKSKQIRYWWIQIIYNDIENFIPDT